MNRPLTAALALLLALLLAAAAHADTLRLKDGRVLEGRIIERTRSKLVFEALISNIPMRLELRYSEIESIEEGEAPTPETPAAKPAPRERPALPSRTDPSAKTEPEHFLVVPIVGTYGEQIGPSGVQDAIDYAARRGVAHLVFHIDSPGGYLWAAEEIAQVLADRPDGIRTYAVVDHAISAAIWTAFACDERFFRTDSTIGGAVAYTQDSSTGAVEVDAKMNSVYAARLAGIAARNGVPEAVARAMTLYEAPLYMVTGEDGELEFTEERRPGAEKLDAEDTVLTLTGSQAAKYRIGRLYDGEVDALGEALEIEGWTRFSDYGEAAMRRGERSLRQRNDLYESRGELFARFTSLVEQYVASHPEAAQYQIHEGGAMTSTSIRLWQRRTDAAIAAVEGIVDVIRDLDVLERRATRLGIDDFIDRDDIAEWRDASRDVIRDLRANRNKSTF